MNDELSAILGRYEELVGKLQEKYGIAKDQAGHHDVNDYKIIVEQLKNDNKRLVKLYKALSKNGKSDGRLIKSKTSFRKRK